MTALPEKKNPAGAALVTAKYAEAGADAVIHNMWDLIPLLNNVFIME